MSYETDEKRIARLERELADALEEKASMAAAIRTITRERDKARADLERARRRT